MSKFEGGRWDGGRFHSGRFAGAAEAADVVLVTFGALTLAGAGGIAKPAGATTISDAGGTNLVLSTGYAVPDTGGTVTSGTVTWDDGTTWTVTAEADSYSVSDGELAAVIALGSATIDGKTIKGRPGADIGGTSTGDTVTISNANTYSTGLTITSEDAGDPAYCRRLSIACIGTLNITDLKIRDTYRVGIDGSPLASGVGLITLATTLTDTTTINFDGCEFYDTTDADTYDISTVLSGSSATAAASTTIQLDASTDLSGIVAYEHGIRTNNASRIITAVNDGADQVTVDIALTASADTWTIFNAPNWLRGVMNTSGYPNIAITDCDFHDFDRAFTGTYSDLTVTGTQFDKVLSDNTTITMANTSTATHSWTRNNFGRDTGAGAPYDPHIDGIQYNLSNFTTSGQNTNPIIVHGNTWLKNCYGNAVFFENAAGGTVVVDIQHNVLLKTGLHAISVENIAAGSIIKGNTVLADGKYTSGTVPQIYLSGTVESGIETAHNVAASITGGGEYENHEFGTTFAANDPATYYVPLFTGATADYNSDNLSSWDAVRTALTPDGNATLWPSYKPRIGAMGGYYDYTTGTDTAPWNQTAWAGNQTWGNLTDQTTSTAVASNKVQVSGVGANGVDVRISGGVSATMTLYDTDSTTVLVSGVTLLLATNGQYVEIHDTTSSGGGTQTDITVKAGNTTDGTWSHTTVAVESPVDEGASTGTFSSSGGYRIWTAANGDELVVDTETDFNAIIVAGGGAGGYNRAGGGGAGEYVERLTTGTPLTLTAGTYAAVVGTGGGPAGSSSFPGGSGGNSTFGGLTALGGGGGGSAGSTTGANGGSGGGGSAGGSGGSSTASDGVGYGGGNSATNAGGGGGGASAVGGNYSGNLGGDGGAGIASPVPGESGTYYSGGGGGGSRYAAGGAGGSGGGGTGADSTNTLGTAGTNGLGGGGGGGTLNYNGFAGGSGIIKVWWPE